MSYAAQPPINIVSSDALIVVDVQNDFCPQGALPVAHGDRIIPRINQLMPHFEHIIFTQDFHPKDHCSFASNHPHHQPLDIIDLPYGKQILWADHCVQGTHGADFHPHLRQDFAHLIIRKGYRRHIDSYSAFLESDGKTSTGLSGYLAAHHIRRVFFVGLATDFCVAWSAIDARKFGLISLVIIDACAAIDTHQSLKNAFIDMDKSGVQRIESKHIIGD